MSKIRPPFKYHGGKYYLCDWIISNFPEHYEHMTYIEPYIGGGSVLLNKKKSHQELLNDIDLNIVSIYNSLLNYENDFLLRLRNIPYCEESFNKALKNDFGYDYIGRAVNEYVLLRMSRGGLKKSFAFSNRLRGGQPGDVNAWKTSLDNLKIVGDRIQDVMIRCCTAISLIDMYDGPNTLLYLDPPYIAESRVSKKAYSHEMSNQDHIDLFNVVDKSKGKVLISGYKSSLYDDMYKHWNKVEKNIVNHSSQSKVKKTKTEILYKNF